MQERQRLKTFDTFLLPVAAARSHRGSISDEYVEMDQTSEAEKVDRRKKFSQIIQALLDAGYHRAIITTLSDFDKVVGGLCWCITSIGIDVDVDILFQENSTIGQRIALSEAIIAALHCMGCPTTLQAHQIQGIAFILLHSILVTLHPDCISYVLSIFKQIRSL